MSDLKLQSPRDIVSPREGNKWDSQEPVRPGAPGFEEALCEVTEAVRMAEMGEWPAEYLAKGNPTDLGGAMPVLLKKKLGISGQKASRNLAMSVSMDAYWHLCEYLLDELRRQGVKFKTDRPGTIQFCDKEASTVALMRDFHNRASLAIDRIFDIKYAWRQPRPEDVLGVHGSVFTVDGYGAPGHWAYGAGHATFASVTNNVLHDHLALEGDLSEQTTHECFMFAFGRTPLGVHFLADNIEGWRVGSQF